MMAEQTANRGTDGKFTKGNTIGNRFEPGESGNPDGRHGSMSDLFKELAKAEDSKEN